MDYQREVRQQKIDLNHSTTSGSSRAGPALKTLIVCIIQVEAMLTDGGEMEVGDYTDDITCTDLANGKRLARFCGNDLCYVVEFKSWYVWDGKRWAEDKGNVEVNRRAKQVAEIIFAEADNYDEEKAKAVRRWACNSCNKSRL